MHGDDYTICHKRGTAHIKYGAARETRRGRSALTWVLILAALICAVFGLGACDAKDSGAPPDTAAVAVGSTEALTSASAGAVAATGTMAAATSAEPAGTGAPSVTQDATGTLAAASGSPTVSASTAASPPITSAASATAPSSPAATGAVSTLAAPAAGTPDSAATPTPLTLPRVSLRLDRGAYPRVDGSTATIPLSVALARAVTGMEQSEAEAFVQHTKTTDSFVRLASGDADLLLVYAPAESVFTDIEATYGVAKSDFVMAPIGRDALVFLVNDQNPVTSLTPGQLADIYAGKTTRWSELTGTGGRRGAADGARDEIVAFQRNETSGSHVMLKNLVLKDRAMAEAPSELITAEMEGLVRRVAEYNNAGNAIGYSVYYYFHNMYNVEGVRALDIDGVPCEDAAIMSGAYPLTQDFYAVILRGEPADSDTRKLFNLVTGHEGAALIRAAGYTPTLAAAGDSRDRPPDSSPGQPGAAAVSHPASAHEGWRGYIRRPDNQGDLPGAGTAASANVFPLISGGKTGFVDASGRYVIEPRFDECTELMVLPGRGGADGYVTSADEFLPARYFAVIYARDGRGVIDRAQNTYAAVIGSDGSVLYETEDPDIDLTYAHADDGSFIGYGGQLLIRPDGRAVMFEDGLGISPELYGGRRILYDMQNGGVSLTDANGEKLAGGAAYDRFVEYNPDNGDLVFERDGGLYAVDRSGREKLALPADINDLRYFPESKLYAYESDTIVRRDQYNEDALWGLMDAEFNRLTGPEWVGCYPVSGGGSFFVTLPYMDPSGFMARTLIGTDGSRLTERDFYDITPAAPAYANRPSHSQTYFVAIPSARARGERPGKGQLIDASGRVYFEDTENLRLCNIMGGYVAMRYSETGFDAESEGFGIDNIGLKSLKGPAALGNTAPDGWVIPPEYGNIRTDGCEKYLHATKYTNDSEGDTHTIFDTETGEILMSGNYKQLYFAGFASAAGFAGNAGFASAAGFAGNTGAAGADAYAGGVFYAETSLRRGYLNERGEWIVSAPLFDTLSADE